MSASEAWYLVRTKSNRETYVRERLSHFAPQVFLPMLKVFGAPRVNSKAVPLFPQYIFVRFDLASHYFDVRYLPGVSGFVTSGSELLEVPDRIVDSVRARCTDEVVQMRPTPLQNGDRVHVVEGPFRNFEAVFEGYLSGAKRVAILIDAIEGCGIRIIADASTVTAAATSHRPLASEVRIFPNSTANVIECATGGHGRCVNRGCRCRCHKSKVTDLLNSGRLNCPA
jgi:transcriptional antiterminator RfaH